MITATPSSTLYSVAQLSGESSRARNTQRQDDVHQCKHAQHNAVKLTRIYAQCICKLTRGIVLRLDVKQTSIVTRRSLTNFTRRSTYRCGARLGNRHIRVSTLAIPALTRHGGFDKTLSLMQRKYTQRAEPRHV